MAKHSRGKAAPEGAGIVKKKKIKTWHKVLIAVLLLLLIIGTIVAVYAMTKLNKIERVEIDETELSCDNSQLLLQEKLFYSISFNFDFSEVSDFSTIIYPLLQNFRLSIAINKR